MAEIDLIFTKENRIILVEVKRLSHPWRAFERIGKKQLIALHKNLILFSALFNKHEVKAYVCWVDQRNKATFIAME